MRFSRAVRPCLLRLLPILALAVSNASAQVGEMPTQNVPYEFDSGWHQNEGTAPEVIISFPVVHNGATWLRLYFEETQLSGNANDGSGSLLRITALRDGSIQELSSRHLDQWQNSSAYFNGDTVLVEVVAQPGTGWNRIAMRSIGGK